MLVINKIINRGDTLIEVLFAISVFSLVVVGSLSLMNQGVNASQRALEITLVRNEIDAQAETLRFLNASYIAAYTKGSSYSNYSADTSAGQWAAMSNDIDLSAAVSTFGGTDACAIPSAPNKPFIFDTRNAKYLNSGAANFISSAQTFSQVKYENGNISTEGIWIEASKSDFQATRFIDFHIRACWSAPGQSIPLTIGTIVRLYEPI